MKFCPALVLAVTGSLFTQLRARAEVKRKIVQIPGDLVLGGLFPMHEQVILLLVVIRQGQ